MCFSASASFGLGITLSAIGAACIKRINTPTAYFFGSIPLIFAIQQLSEGFLWLALSMPIYLYFFTVNISYLFGVFLQLS